ncbi:Uncharacterised protein [Enterobacter cloacae]|nr:Uncharacterised protein [Enterobacter cloacae]
MRQGFEALPASHVKQRGDGVGDKQCRDHHRKNNPPRQRCAKNTHG